MTTTASGRCFALVDDQLVEDSMFLRRHVGEPVLKQPAPAIERGEALGSVLHDPRDGTWRMWYVSLYACDPERDLVGCETPLHYATSSDGLNWELPQLGLVEHRGSKANNILIGRHHPDRKGRYFTGYGGVAGWCVLDAEQSPHPAARGRYTAMYQSSPFDTYGGICLATSDDGITWEAYRENPVIPGNQDTQNCVFFDRRGGK